MPDYEHIPGPAPARLPRPSTTAFAVVFGIGLIIAVPSHAQRIAQIELVAIAALAVHLLLRHVQDGVDSAATDDVSRWSLKRSRLGRIVRRGWVKISPFARAPVARAGKRTTATIGELAMADRSNDALGPVPDGIVRLGRHVQLMSMSEFNTVVHLRPTVLRLIEHAPGAASEPAVAHILEMTSPWEAARDDGGLSATTLDQIVTAFEREYER
jgi:hypothetical protein